MTRLLTLAMTTTALCASDTMAFVSRPAFQTQQIPSIQQQPVPRLNMLPQHDDLTSLAAPLLSSTIAIPSGSLLGTASSALLDPFIEAEFFQDMAHVGLDLTALLGPVTPYLRLMIVLGRLCAIASDYIPDHFMTPEEIVFQGLMLVVASGAFIQSVLPILLGATAKTTLRDRAAHKVLFEQVGVSWTQYKAMVAVAFDWVQVGPYQGVVDDEDYMYWLYAGNIEMNEQSITAGSGYHGLIGELRLTQLLDDKESTVRDPLNIQAGGTGATLLRINTKKLSQLIDGDDRLARSIRSLLVKGMHEKLSALTVQGEEEN